MSLSTNRNVVWFAHRRHSPPPEPTRIWRGVLYALPFALLFWAAVGAWLVSDSDVDAWSHRIAAEVRR